MRIAKTSSKNKPIFVYRRVRRVRREKDESFKKNRNPGVLRDLGGWKNEPNLLLLDEIVFIGVDSCSFVVHLKNGTKRSAFLR